MIQQAHLMKGGGHSRPLDAQLCFALYTTSLAITRTYRPMLDALGLTYPQFLVLYALGEQDGMTVSEIARRLSLESSTITPLVKRMATTGHVRRRRDPGDERYVHIHLTDSGEAMQGEIACIADTVWAQTGLSLDAMIALIDQLTAVRTALGAAARPS